MWDAPFDESMLNDPRGILVICTCADDAVELERILSDHGIHDWPGTLEERYNMCIKRYPGRDVCFNILDKRIAEDADEFRCSAEYCYRSYYENEPEYDSCIKCTFYGADTPDFEAANDDELMALLGMRGT